MQRQRFSIVVALTLGVLVLGATLVLLNVASAPSQAQSSADVIRVATSGADAPGCGSAGSPCQTIQYAVDQAADGDKIHVAAGTYTGVQSRAAPFGYSNPPASGVITQVLFVDKPVTIQGGYTTTNGFADPPDPVPNLTIVDAQQQGRAMFAAATVTIEGLCLTNGDASGLGGHDSSGSDAGGGVYLYQSDDSAIRDTKIYTNSSQTGGGLYSWYSERVMLVNNVIFYNKTHQAYTDRSGGGGLYVNYGSAIVMRNTISNNMALTSQGGGLHAHYADVTVAHNVIIDNRSYYDGGGVYLNGCDQGKLLNNTISGNWTTTQYGSGGGVSLEFSDAALADNFISGNAASADHNAYDGGGGLNLYYSDAILSRNVIISNTSARSGGGMLLRQSDAKLDNNVIADNQADADASFEPGTGAGVHVYRSNSQFSYTTLARNYGGDGSGVCVTGRTGDPSRVAVTNTIIVSHTFGITVSAGSTVTLESTLWGSGAWANDTPWDGGGTTVPSDDHWGNPDFVDYTTGDYHIGPSSDALDKGIGTAGIMDIDHEPHFYQAPDLGADEYWLPGALKRVYLPLVMQD